MKRLRFAALLVVLAVLGIAAPAAMAAGATSAACPAGYTAATTIAAVQTAVSGGHNTCFNASGTLSGTMTLSNPSASAVEVFDNAGTATLSGQIRVQSDKVHLTNFRIAQVGGGTGLTGDCVRFETAGSANVWLKNSTISGCGRDAVRFGATTSTTAGNVLSNNLVTSAGFNFCTCYGLASVDTNDVKGIGNDFLDGWAITTVKSNKWHDSADSTNSAFCPVEGCHNDFFQTWQTSGDPAVGAPLVNTVVEANVVGPNITGPNSHGFAIDGSANTGIVVRGNAFYASTTGTSMLGGFFKDAQSTKVYGNTFKGSASTDTLEFLATASATVSSNLFEGCHSSGTLLWTVGTGTITHDYNYQNGCDKTVSGETHGVNLASDPTVSGDWHTSVTTLENLADTAWTTRLDPDGQSILGGRMDIGVDEKG